MEARPSWFIRVLVCISQFGNVVFFDGMPDEMLSARAYRCRAKSKGWRWLREFLDAGFFWQKGHCRQIYLWEKDRRDDPEAYH